MPPARPARTFLLPLTLLALGAQAASGCGEDCCTIDSFPIPLDRAPLGGGDSSPTGALLAQARSPSVQGGQPFPMVVDTGSPFTVLNGDGDGTGLQAYTRSFDILDAGRPTVLRAQFRDITLLDLALGPVGGADIQPRGVFGGDLLRSFSVDVRLGGPCPAGASTPTCPSMTLWPRQAANEGFLEDAGYAVLRFTLFGGGEVTASGDPDLFGARAPLQLPPTRAVLRACAAPRAFSPTEPRELCCARGDEVSLSTGVDLSLLLATGVGPLVLSASAWDRLEADMLARGLPLAPFLDQDPPPLMLAVWPSVTVLGWTSIPRLALVDLETGANEDPGPCVELGRARRIEWASYQEVNGQITEDPIAANTCVQVCDTDPRQPDLARNSAAYLELGGTIPVAVVADTEPFLQSLRADIRPEGPEIDGVLGAGALGPARVELDFPSTPSRALFSCEPGAARDACWAAARCPRLSDHVNPHYCFGLGPHTFPATCSPSGC